MAELGQFDIFVVEVCRLNHKCVLSKILFYAQKLKEIDHYTSNMQKFVHFGDLACILESLGANRIHHSKTC